MKFQQKLLVTKISKKFICTQIAIPLELALKNLLKNICANHHSMQFKFGKLSIKKNRFSDISMEAAITNKKKSIDTQIAVLHKLAPNDLLENFCASQHPYTIKIQ